MKNILCYGDSNTYGRIPLAKDGKRFERNQRWLGILEKMLGSQFHIIEEGLGGRTSVITDEIEGRMSGLDYITPCLLSHSPLDLVILQLGTNDMKARYSLTPVDIALGVERVIKTILSSSAGIDGRNPKVLALVPLHINDVGHFKFHEMFKGADRKSRSLLPYFISMEEKYNDLKVLNPSDSINPSSKDGLHLDQEGHKSLAALIYKTINEEMKI